MRLKKIQAKLFDNQISMNKSLENNEIDVLVENKIDGDDKFFGRSEHMTSVIFNGSLKFEKKDNILNLYRIFD